MLLIYYNPFQENQINWKKKNPEEILATAWLAREQKWRTGMLLPIRPYLCWFNVLISALFTLIFELLLFWIRIGLVFAALERSCSFVLDHRRDIFKAWFSLFYVSVSLFLAVYWNYFFDSAKNVLRFVDIAEYPQFKR